jgi:hypothetical protein
MTETPNFKKIFDEISTADGHVVGKINYYNLTAHLEELYLLNQELQDRVKALEGKQINFEGCYD